MMRLERDGCFCLQDQGVTLIGDLFPGIDGAPIRGIGLEANEQDGSMRVCSKDGDISIRHEALTGGRGEFRLNLQNREKPIHTLSVFFEAPLNELQGFYQAPHGLGGASGYIPAAELMKRDEVVSDAVCSLKLGGRNITFYGSDHAHYRNTYVLRRKGSRFFFSVNIVLENTLPDNGKLPAIRMLTEGAMDRQLETAAKEIGAAMNARLGMPPAYHWCSWYYCYHNFDLPQLAEYLEGFSVLPEAKGIQYFQIDVGYSVSMGDWLIPTDRFPNGLKEAFDLIREYGYTPGIWVGPYMIGNRSRLYSDHLDWILRDVNDDPITPWLQFNEPKPWGYQDEEYFVLDTSHPEAMAYMCDVFATLKRWGAGLFKTDFMLWGIQDSAKVKRHTPGKTSVEYFRDFMEAIRQEIGEESYWLGCIAPFLPFVGYADGMRVGGDVGSKWDDGFGPKSMIEAMTGSAFCNHAYFQIDPDAVMLRDFHIELTETEVVGLALLAGMAGGCIYTSDPLHKIARRRRELFHFLKPDVRRKPYIPFLDTDREEIVMVHSEKNGLVLLFNKTDRDITNGYRLEAFGIDADNQVYDFASGEEQLPVRGQYYIRIPAHGHVLLKTSKEPVVLHRDSLWKNLYE